MASVVQEHLDEMLKKGHVRAEIGEDRKTRYHVTELGTAWLKGWIDCEKYMLSAQAKRPARRQSQLRRR